MKFSWNIYFILGSLYASRLLQLRLTQGNLQTCVDDNHNFVEVLDQEGVTPDTIDNRLATVDDSIVLDNFDDVDDLAVDSQDLVGIFGSSEVTDNIFSQLEGDSSDTIDDRQATVDDSIVGDNEDDINDLAVDSQGLVGVFGYSEVTDNIFSQLDGVDSSESDMDEDEEFNTYNMFHLGNRSKRPRVAPVIQSSDSEQENSDSDRQSIVSPETLEEEVNNEEPKDPEPQISTFNLPKEKMIQHNGREHVILPNTGPSYILCRSHRAKPSVIWRHCNDLISLAEVEPSMKQKPVLALILDDGN